MTRNLGLWCVVVLVGVGSIGCNAVDASKGLFANAPRPGVEGGQDTPTATVEFHSQDRAQQAVKVPIRGESFHVQQALENSGAWKKYGRANITVSRQTPQGRRTQMTVSYDRGKHRVEPQCDYQVLPGDVIVVTEDPTTFVDEMLDKVAPFRNRPAKHS